MNFQQLTQDVGRWSKANFEETYCRELPVRWIHLKKQDDKEQTDPDAEVIAGLGSVAPLMGMTEEIGELLEADTAGDMEAVEDAVGDILIYLADWCYRESFSFPEIQSILQQSPEKHLKQLGIACGKLYHAKLKRCQGIRAMPNNAVYQTAVSEAMISLVSHLQAYMQFQYANDKPEVCDLLVIANHTWETVVSKRQWKTWPRTGVES